MKRLNLEILSPEGSMFSGLINRVTIPTVSGQVTILPDHVPLFTKLADGEVVVFTDEEPAFVAISGGFVEVARNTINILAEFAVRSEELEEEIILKAKSQAENALRSAKEKESIVSAEKELHKTILELKVSQKVRKRRKRI